MRNPSIDPFIPRDRDWHPKPHFPNYKSSVARSPRRALISFGNSPSETTGPVFGHDILGQLDNDLILNHARDGHCAQGARTIVQGRLLDEHGRGVAGALIEVWQANSGGRYRHKKDGYQAPLDPDFGGCGRVVTDHNGFYEFRTIRPGAYPWPNGVNDWRPAHIHFSVFGDGFAQRLITQMYFEGDPLIPRCPIVATLADAHAVDQLTAKLDMNASVPLDALCYRFDIVLRGRRSTYFESKPEGN